MEENMQQDIKNAVVASLSLQNLTDSEQDKMVAIMMDNVSSRINMAVWERLSDEDKNELIDVLRAGTAKTLEYLNSKIEDFPILVQNVTHQTMEDFKAKRLAIV